MRGEECQGMTAVSVDVNLKTSRGTERQEVVRQDTPSSVIPVEEK
jgi:hypothetical protein